MNVKQLVYFLRSCPPRAEVRIRVVDENLEYRDIEIRLDKPLSTDNYDGSVCINQETYGIDETDDFKRLKAAKEAEGRHERHFIRG